MEIANGMGPGFTVRGSELVIVGHDMDIIQSNFMVLCAIFTDP